MVVVCGEVPLAARRACRTCFDGAMRLDDADIDARTGAIIRGSSMAAVVLCGAAAVLETFRCSGRVSPLLALAPATSHERTRCRHEQHDTEALHSISRSNRGLENVYS